MRAIGGRMMSNLIYSIEDDVNIGRIIRITLEKQGYQVVSFVEGEAFLKTFREIKPDLILLDLMLPDYDGFDLIREIRKDSSNDEIPIIIVSAKSQIIDKVDGLDLGADDYLEKPFDILELISRVNAKLRRKHKEQAVTIDGMTIDAGKRVFTIDGKEIMLTNAEFNVLYTLMKKSDNVVSRDELLSALWGEKEVYESRTIDVHVKSLRSKLGEKKGHIYSVYGIGYKFKQ